MAVTPIEEALVGAKYRLHDHAFAVSIARPWLSAGAVPVTVERRLPEVMGEDAFFAHPASRSSDGAGRSWAVIR